MKCSGKLPWFLGLFDFSRDFEGKHCSSCDIMDLLYFDLLQYLLISNRNSGSKNELLRSEQPKQLF